jgi:hypothetical protein
VHVAIIIFLVILLLLTLSSTTCEEEPVENFDTYYNHDMGNHTIYQVNNPDMSVNESRLTAKYTWSARNADGRNVMDSYYENVARQKNDGYDPREAPSYDTKFGISESGKGYKLKDMENNKLVSQFHHMDMDRPEENYRVELSQKLWF